MIRAILTSGSMRSLRHKPDRSWATKPGHISCHRHIRGVGLDHLGSVVGEPILEVDAGDWRWQLAQVAGRGADKLAQLPETPVGGGDQLGLARQHESEPV